MKSIWYISKQEVSSQKDFTGVGGPEINLNIEIKKTDSNHIMCNDTCPNEKYLLYNFNDWKHAISPQLVFLNGLDIIRDSSWKAEYQKEINEIKDKWCRGETKEAITPSL